MAESTRSARAYVKAEDGTKWSFGEFLEQRRGLSGKSIQDVVKNAKISRASYYNLKDAKQRPTLTTAVALFSALDLRCELPTSDDEFEVDLHIYDGDNRYVLVLEWTADDRSRARDRFLSSADLGVAAGAALGGIGLGGVAAAALGGAAGAAAFPVAGPLAASVFIATRQMKKAREQQRMQQRRDGQKAAPAPAKQELIDDFKAAADQMSTEDLEALLAAMKALRESNSD